jgi:hypothetical protein
MSSIAAMDVIKCGKFWSEVVVAGGGVEPFVVDAVDVGITTIRLSDSLRVFSLSSRRERTRPKYRMLIPRTCIAVEREAPSMMRALGPKNVEPLSRAHELLMRETNTIP